MSNPNARQATGQLDPIEREEVFAQVALSNFDLLVDGLELAVFTSGASDVSASDVEGKSAIFVDDTQSARTVNLPSSYADEGQVLLIFDTSGNANNNNISVSASEDINGGSSDVTAISSAYGHAWVVSDGSAFYVS